MGMGMGMEMGMDMGMGMGMGRITQQLKYRNNYVHKI